MLTRWTCGDLDELRGTAEIKNQAALDDLRTPERDFVTTLPYYGAFAEYRDHVVGCATCRDTEDDCSEGGELRRIARVGLEEQARIALSN